MLDILWGIGLAAAIVLLLLGIWRVRKYAARGRDATAGVMVRRDQGAEALEAGREVAYMQQEERRDPVAVQPETGETSGMKAEAESRHE